MGALGDLFGGLLKPLLVALLVLTGMSLFSNRPDAGGTGVAFECRSYTSDPELNRLICRYHPVRLWNMPIGDLIPWLDARAPE